MKTYTASQELIDILLKNGFVDKTAKVYPDTDRAIKERGYKEGNDKRVFSLAAMKDYITFDYQSIICYVNNTGFTDELELTENQVRSIIAYYKMTPKFKHDYANDCFHLNEQLHLSDSKFMRIFNTVVLN